MALGRWHESQWARPLGVLAMFALAFAVYAPALRGAFLWDDAIIFGDDAITHGASPWTWWSSFRHADYWPVTYTVFWALYQVLGDDPLGYHVVLVALHVVNALLVGAVLRRLGTIAWPGMLLFLLHPVHVESVAYVFQLKTVLATMWLLVAVLAYLRYEPGAWRWLALSLAAFALSLLTKTSTALLPAALALHVWWARRPAPAALVVVPYVAVAALFTAITMHVNARHHGPEVVWDAGVVERVLTAARNTWFYLRTLLAPADLSAVYARVSSPPAALTSWLWLAAALAAATAVVVWARRAAAGRAAALGLGWFVVHLAPALGFTNVYYMKFSLVADHWQYLASIGVLALVSPLFAWAHRASAAGTSLVRRAPLILAALLLLGCALTSWRRAHTFADSFALWRATVEQAPASALAHNNWGVELYAAGNHEGAMLEFRRAVALSPRYDEALYNVGFMLERRGHLADAEHHYLAALAATPDHVRSFTGLARLYLRTNRLDDADRAIAHALSLRPRDRDALTVRNEIATRRGTGSTPPSPQNR